VVAELHVATVRALMLGDIAEHLRLIREVDRENSVDAYGLFYEVVFGCVVRRRLGPEATHGDVIRLVAEVRANQTAEVDDFDILAAERLLRGLLGDEAAFQRLTHADSALIAPLLLGLGRMLPPDELLAESEAITEQLEQQLVG
jgi:hypothetical protein